MVLLTAKIGRNQVPQNSPGTFLRLSGATASLSPRTLPNKARCPRWAILGGKHVFNCYDPPTILQSSSQLQRFMPSHRAVACIYGISPDLRNATGRRLSNVALPTVPAGNQYFNTSIEWPTIQTQLELFFM